MEIKPRTNPKTGEPACSGKECPAYSVKYHYAVKSRETGKVFGEDRAIHRCSAGPDGRLHQMKKPRAPCMPAWRKEVARLRVESAEAFVEWLVGCRQPSGFEVHVTGTEGGHPFDRMVSLTDALTDFRARED